jgi:uncharacterized membrane protein YphA (DoxX/SURF4 family)
MATLLCRLVCGSLFFGSGIEKSVRFRAFHAAVVRYNLIPRRAVPWFGIFVFLAEVAVGFALLVGRGVTSAAVIGLALLATFTAAIVTALMRGKAGMPCGCMGLKRNSKISLLAIVRNIVLGQMLLVCVLPEHGKPILVAGLAACGSIMLLDAWLRANLRRRAVKPRPGRCRGCGERAAETDATVSLDASDSISAASTAAGAAQTTSLGA